MNPASRLLLVGPMGAGKTSIGKRVARAFGLPFVDADRELERRTGASIALIFELEGEAGFRRRESALLAELCQGPGQVVATGGGAVLDPANRECLRRGGFVVHIAASVGQQLARLEKDRNRPLLATPDRSRRLEEMAALRNPLYAEVADLVFDSDGLAVATASARLVEQLRAAWRRPEVARAG